MFYLFVEIIKSTKDKVASISNKMIIIIQEIRRFFIFKKAERVSSIKQLKS